MLHKLNRWYNRVYALLGGFFWKPCRICGEMYGGHECAGMGLMTSWTSGHAVCRNCADTAAARNAEWMEQHPFDSWNVECLVILPGQTVQFTFGDIAPGQFVRLGQ